MTNDRTTARLRSLGERMASLASRVRGPGHFRKSTGIGYYSGPQFDRPRPRRDEEFSGCLKCGGTVMALSLSVAVDTGINAALRERQRGAAQGLDRS